MLVRRAIAFGCALLALACGCSGSGSAGRPSTTTIPATTSRPAPSTSAVTTTTIPRVTTTTQPAPGSLGALILSAAPSGFSLQPDDVADTGPTNLAKAALDELSDNPRQELVDAGFVDGYQRQWTSVDAAGTAINQDFLFLYQFDTPEGAQAYAQHWRVSLLTTNQGFALESFTPTFIAGAIGLRVQDDAGSTGVVIFAKGPYAVKVLVNGGPGVDQSGPASQLALAQFLRLP